MRRVRLVLAGVWAGSDVVDIDTGEHIGGYIFASKDNMLALALAARHRPAEAEVQCVDRPLRRGPDGELATHRERVLVVEARPFY